MPIRRTTPCSAAEHLTHLWWRGGRLQASERLHARVAEPSSGLVRVVDADQAGLVAAAAVVAERQGLTVGQLRALACGEAAGVTVHRTDAHAHAVVVNPAALPLAVRVLGPRRRILQ